MSLSHLQGFTMKKLLTLALIVGTTTLFAAPPMGNGPMNNNGGMMGGGMMRGCNMDSTKLPKPFEALGLSDAQKADIQKIREEGKAFHKKQHEKMMSVLTPDQRKTFETTMQQMRPQGGMRGMRQGGMGNGGGMQNQAMPDNGMGCDNCPEKK
jgi:Spy/CpxP family protein refolding chaperone